MAQLVEHILGKDEVPGSNPGISLKRRHLEIGAIFIFSELRSEIRRWRVKFAERE